MPTLPVGEIRTRSCTTLSVFLVEKTRLPAVFTEPTGQLISPMRLSERSAELQKLIPPTGTPAAAPPNISIHPRFDPGPITKFKEPPYKLFKIEPMPTCPALEIRMRSVALVSMQRIPSAVPLPRKNRKPVFHVLLVVVELYCMPKRIASLRVVFSVTPFCAISMKLGSPR